MKNVKALLAVLLLSSAPAIAAPVEYELDAAHTQVFFAVNHLGFSNSHGRFLDFTGGFTFDEAAPEASTVDVSIDTDSLDMASERWEDHLKGPDFFNVEKFPKMTFKGTKIEKTGEKTGKLTGDLTLLGVTKPVTLDVTFNKAGEHPMMKTPWAGFSARGTLKRSEFGMNYGLPNVADDVSLIIEVEAGAKKAKVERTEQKTEAK
jgi:polyisoprenoid-binding protein YceI